MSPPSTRLRVVIVAPVPSLKVHCCTTISELSQLTPSPSVFAKLIAAPIGWPLARFVCKSSNDGDGVGVGVGVGLGVGVLLFVVSLVELLFVVVESCDVEFVFVPGLVVFVVVDVVPLPEPEEPSLPEVPVPLVDDAVGVFKAALLAVLVLPQL